MSSVLLCALAGMGVARHVVSVAEALVARGHRVSVVSGEAARTWYHPLDVDFHAVPERPMPELLQSLPPLLRRSKQVYARVQRNVIEPLPEQWEVVRRVLHDAAVDVVVSDPLFLGGSALAFVPRAVRPPVVLLGAFAPWIPDPGLAPYGMGIPPGDVGSGPTLALPFELVAAPAYANLSRSFNRQVERVHGVRIHGDLRSTPAAADAWLQLTVPRFEYERTTLPAGFRFIGPLRPAAADPAPEWWSPVTEPPVVAVRAEGSAALHDLVLPTIAAFGGTADTVVIAGTARDVVADAHSGPLPANVHFEDRLPWSRLIPRRSVVVSDGDYLHTQHALRAGVPVVVAGTLETDVETGARVEWSGAGVNLRRRRPDPTSIRTAVERIRADDGFRLAAARIAAQIDDHDAEAAICGLVEQYARATV